MGGTRTMPDERITRTRYYYYRRCWEERKWLMQRVVEGYHLSFTVPMIYITHLYY